MFTPMLRCEIFLAAREKQRFSERPSTRKNH